MQVALVNRTMSPTTTSGLDRIHVANLLLDEIERTTTTTSQIKIGSLRKYNPVDVILNGYPEKIDTAITNADPAISNRHRKAVIDVRDSWVPMFSHPSILGASDLSKFLSLPDLATADAMGDVMMRGTSTYNRRFSKLWAVVLGKYAKDLLVTVPGIAEEMKNMDSKAVSTRAVDDMPASFINYHGRILTYLKSLGNVGTVGSKPLMEGLEGGAAAVVTPAAGATTAPVVVAPAVAGTTTTPAVTGTTTAPAVAGTTTATKPAEAIAPPDVTVVRAPDVDNVRMATRLVFQQIALSRLITTGLLSPKTFKDINMGLLDKTFPDGKTLYDYNTYLILEEFKVAHRASKLLIPGASISEDATDAEYTIKTLAEVMKNLSYIIVMTVTGSNFVEWTRLRNDDYITNFVSLIIAMRDTVLRNVFLTIGDVDGMAVSGKLPLLTFRTTILNQLYPELKWKAEGGRETLDSQTGQVSNGWREHVIRVVHDAAVGIRIRGIINQIMNNYVTPANSPITLNITILVVFILLMIAVDVLRKMTLEGTSPTYKTVLPVLFSASALVFLVLKLLDFAIRVSVQMVDRDTLDTIGNLKTTLLGMYAYLRTPIVAAIAASTDAKDKLFKSPEIDSNKILSATSAVANGKATVYTGHTEGPTSKELLFYENHQAYNTSMLYAGIVGLSVCIIAMVSVMFYVGFTYLYQGDLLNGGG